jgi:hypothetical protein
LVGLTTVRRRRLVMWSAAAEREPRPQPPGRSRRQQLGLRSRSSSKPIPADQPSQTAALPRRPSQRRSARQSRLSGMGIWFSRALSIGQSGTYRRLTVRTPETAHTRPADLSSSQSISLLRSTAAPATGEIMALPAASCASASRRIWAHSSPPLMRRWRTTLRRTGRRCGRRRTGCCGPAPAPGSSSSAWRCARHCPGAIQRSAKPDGSIDKWLNRAERAPESATKRPCRTSVIAVPISRVKNKAGGPAAGPRPRGRPRAMPGNSTASFRFAWLKTAREEPRCGSPMTEPAQAPRGAACSARCCWPDS